ncbi:MAG TPA: ABC transporter substrate-binding protein [Gemmobacter sp.]|nr:ABC transporter substrate-binding protein [Gemmobacter sp.]HBU14093.1 ABC transporter substrate-binding protein [Gemmobacter sp.]
MIKMTKLCTLLAATVLSAGAAWAEVGNHVLRLGTPLPDAHPISQAAVKFAELVAEKSGGKIEVKVYPGSTLGNELQMQSALQGGTQDFSIGTTTTLAGMVPEFSAIDMPYQFRTTAEADAVLDGAIGTQLFDKLAPKGLIGLAYMEQGFRHTTNSTRPITKWEDFDGLKIRVQPSALYIDMFNQLGANAVPMTINEVYTAMETRAIDGHENSLTAIDANKFQEVQTYLSLTGHSYNAVVLLMGQPSFDKLNDEEMQIIRAAAAEARDFQRDLTRKQAEGLLAKLAEDGMEVNEVSPEEQQRLAERLQPVVDANSAAIGAEWMESFGSAVQALR